MISASSIFLRLLLASALGALIGWQRESERKPAGLKTHMMVALGAASFTVGTMELIATGIGNGPLPGSDPAKIIQGLAGGIGFLGGGSIIRARGTVEGITTAASIWIAGAIGLACGVENYALAAMVTAFALFILVVMGRVEDWWAPR